MSPAPPPRIFLTGATGALGHALVHSLLAAPDLSHSHLTLLVRSPERLPPLWLSNPRIQLIHADLATPDLSPLLQRLDAAGPFSSALLAAACWGGPSCDAVNHTNTFALVDYLVARHCPRIQLFSTASALAPDGSLLPLALEKGTPYIAAKARCLQHLLTSGLHRSILVLAPTLLASAGGGPLNAPRSHFSRLLAQALPWFFLARRISGEGSFHFIHAQDIATLSTHFCLPHIPFPAGKIWPLGTAPLTAQAALAEIESALSLAPCRRFPLPPSLIDSALSLFRIQLSSWDSLCLDQRHFTYPDAVSPATFHLPLAFPHLADVIRELKTP